jgi:hypothetical protein
MSAYERRRHRPKRIAVWAAVVMLGAGSRTSAWAQVQAINPANPGPLNLELRLNGNRSQFHLGEIIPIELIFSSPEQRKYPVYEDCTERQSYQYHVPPEFEDRSIELDAGMYMDGLGMGCHGWVGELDLGDKPFVISKILNQRFRMDKPGKYQVSVTANRMGFPVNSTPVELEILPSDPIWEESELKRAVTLIGSARDGGSPSREEGCRVLRYLGTQAAELEMARHEAGPTRCDFDIALISALNRKVVLAELEKGLLDPDLEISVNYLRTLAFVSLYEQHPGWYPIPVRNPGEMESPENGALWGKRGVPQAEEIRYARLLADSLPTKSPSARAFALETLINLGRTLGSIEVPPDLVAAVLKQLPGAFAKMSSSAREYVLLNEWDEFEGPVMESVLKEMIEGQQWFGTNAIALRRLYELSPGAARPYILRLLKDPAVDSYRPGFIPITDRQELVETLGMLTEKELPELDGTMQQRVQSAENEVEMEVSAGLLQRYSSAAIAGPLRSWFDARIGKISCGAEANLLAYFLRVDPQVGPAMLRKVTQTDVPGCLPLKRLARIRMSQEVEKAALTALDDPRPAKVVEALGVLQSYGSPATEEPILRHFRQWHDSWASRAKELDASAGSDQANVEVGYVCALGAAQTWRASEDDWQSFKGLCVTNSCKENAPRFMQCMGSRYNLMIEISDPGHDFEFRERVSIGNPGPGTLERLKEKMLQFPKGFVFTIDARNREKHVIQRYYEELRPWAREHGFDLQIYSE